MSNACEFEHPVKDLSAAYESAELFHGADTISGSPVPSVGSCEYMRERSAISGMLVARTVDMALVPDDSPAGWRFRDALPGDIATVDELGRWIQNACHGALDHIIAADEGASAAADRYQDLVRPDRPLGQTSTATTRRQTLLFDQAVAEPHAWLKIANIAAKFNGKEIRPDQALPFAVGRLAIMHKSARKDVGKQYVRGAILEAATELGEMRHPTDRRDTATRYQVLRTYVATVTGHALPAKNFRNLYSIEDDPEAGVSIAERPEGFGRIKAVREIPLGCPASYMMARRGQRDAIGKPALYKILRAGISAMEESDLFQESLSTSLVPVPVAFAKLNRKVAAKQLEN